MAIEDDAPGPDRRPTSVPAHGDAAPDGPTEVEDAAEQEIEYPADETDEG